MSSEPPKPKSGNTPGTKLDARLNQEPAPDSTSEQQFNMHQPWFPISLVKSSQFNALFSNRQKNSSDSMDKELRLFHRLTKIAELDVNLLLSGETGTGKTCLAKLVHSNSPRADAPFIEINCAAVPETLLESELFGAAKGAHSSAFTAIEGKISAAQGGTLFLDEVNLMSLDMQSKLLQFLNDGQYYPLGSTQLRKANVRLICATNTCLETATNQGYFREDLYHRINTYPVKLRPLRERKDDLVQLALTSCEKAIATHKISDSILSSQALGAISSYAWPGNLRELNNMILRACIEAAMDDSSTIELHHLDLQSPPARMIRPAEQLIAADSATEELKFATQTFQRAYIEKCLMLHQGNVSKTAKVLGLSRGHLHKLMNTLEIDKDVTINTGNAPAEATTQRIDDADMKSSKPLAGSDGKIVEFKKKAR